MASTDAGPTPVKNAAYRVTFPIFDSAGALVTGASALDSERSIDGAAFSDCTNEATEIGSTGIYYLDLTNTEMNGDTIAVIVQSTEGLTVPIVLYPVAGGVKEIYTDTQAIVTDTNELQGDWTNDGRLDVILDAVLADTNELQSDDVPGLIGALNDPTAAAVADAVWDEAATGHTDAGKAGEQLWTDVDAILADTNELQTDDIPGAIAGLNNISASDVTTDIDANSTQLAAIVADTNELQADWTNDGRLDLIIDAILADTNELQTDDIPGAITALNDLSAAQVNAEVVDVLRTDTIPDSVAVDGNASTIAQAIYLILQFLTEKAVSGTTVTVNKVDGTTPLATFTLDSGTSPTTITRAS